MVAEWKAQNIDSAEYIGPLEIQSNNGEYHYFEVVKTGDALVFGHPCNIGLLQSGYMPLDSDARFYSEQIGELVSELETFYNDGARYCSHIIVNERM